MINVYVANLGKYNAGEVVGEWITLPTTEVELIELEERIGTVELVDGVHVKQIGETILLDWETEVEGFDIREYSDIYKLSMEAEVVAEYNDYEVSQAEALVEGGYYNNLIEALDNLDEHCFVEVEDGYNEEENLAYAVIDEIYGGIEVLGEDTLTRYFDVEKFGRDLTFDLSIITEDMEEEDAEELYNMDNEELALWYIEGMGSVAELGRNTLENYFDYEGYGRDMMLEGAYIADNGIAIL